MRFWFLNFILHHIKRVNYLPKLKMSVKIHQWPPFRAEHLGSLLRPAQLLQARASVDKGTATKDKLVSIEDEAVQDIVKMQLDLGFHPISDGEYRRHMFWYVEVPIWLYHSQITK